MSARKLTRISAGDSPGYRGCLASCTSLAASIRFFDGRHPRFTHVPPIVRSSIIKDVLPDSCARKAAAKAVEPEPRMSRSTSETVIQVLLWRSSPLQARDGLVGELLSVEIRRGRTGSELVHPEVRPRRLVLPARALSVNQVDVPRVSRLEEAPRVPLHQAAALVPVMAAA